MIPAHIEAPTKMGRRTDIGSEMLPHGVHVAPADTGERQSRADRLSSPAMRTMFALFLWLGVSTVVAGCGKKQSEFPGSTYCDPKSGGSLIPRSSVPTGTCTGTATCIAFTAGAPCADATQAPGECQWTCTCVADAWDCTTSCGGAMCTSPADAFVVDSSTD
jgi:hypothetical protein